MEATIENAMTIVEKAVNRLFYKKYRGRLRDSDELLSDAQMLIFKKFSSYDPKIGSFEGYINMYVEFAAIRLLSTTYKRSLRRKEHIGTIDDVTRISKDIPEGLDDLVRRAIEIFESQKSMRSDSVRRILRSELQAQGWSLPRIQEAFQEIDAAITGDRVYCYAKTEEV
jgi:hypothetical protein